MLTGRGRGLLGGESLLPCTAPVDSIDRPCVRCLLLTGKVPVLGDTGLGPRAFSFLNLTIEVAANLSAVASSASVRNSTASLPSESSFSSPS